MGIFDRFRTAARAAGEDKNKADDASGQEATQLINEGNAFEAQGRIDEALQRYLEAIRIAPGLARAHLNHGNALLAKGDLKGALDAFKTAIELKPDYAGAYYNMGNAQLSHGQPREAVASYRKALEIKPDYAEVHCALGVALKELGQLDEAVASYRKALELRPDLAEAQANLAILLEYFYNSGVDLLGKGQPGAAAENFRRALKIEPKLADAHYHLGNALAGLGQNEQAAASFRRAVELKPDFAEAHNNLGIALHELKRHADAVASFRRAVELKPDFAAAHNNLGNNLQELGQFDGAEASFRRALEIAPDFHVARSNLLLTLNYTCAQPPSYYLEQAREYGRSVSGNVKARFTAWAAAPRPERLRVGLVSGDLWMHSVGHFLEGMLPHLDATRIDLIAYPTHHREDELTRRIRPLFSAWKPLAGKDDESAARLIHDDGVHILIDLSGHTADNRLPVFGWKPAPVQVTWLGLPSTTGLAEMDYVLGDPYAIPPEFESHFSEAVWRMPESCVCLAVPAVAVNVSPLPALSAGHVTFGSFNNLAKMTDEVVAVWADVLKSVPGSCLLLKTKQLDDPSVCEKTRQRFASCGISLDRLLLVGTQASRKDHLATYNNVDIALDTFPYPGVTTSVEALWMGVPVLSLEGDRFLSRMAGSISRNAGLPGWIAADKNDYVAKAVAHASDLERLAALRAGLRQQVLASPLFDGKRFARNFEDALWGMWRASQKQGMPAQDRYRADGQSAGGGKDEAGASGQEATQLINEGNAFEAQGRIDEALQRYLEAIRIAPGLARAHLNHGNALLAKGDLKGALDAFKTAIELKPDYAGAYYNMGNAQLSHGQPREAVASYRKALEIKSDYAEVHCALGVALKELGKFEDAVASCRRALQLAPGMVEAHYNLGLALQGLGQIENAAASYSRAVELSPAFAEAHFHLGLVRQGAGQLEGAAASYRSALALKPGMVDAHNNLGLVLQSLGQPDRAAESYQRALELRPDYAGAHYNLGNACRELGQLEKALASYRRAVEIKPDFAEAYGNLGVVLYDLGKQEEAMTSYRRAVEIRPDLAEAHNNLGSALKDQGRFAEADACYRRALEIEPGNALFRVGRMFNLPVAPQTAEASAAVPRDFDRAVEELSEWMVSAPDQRERISNALSVQPTFYLAYRDGNHAARLSRFGDLLAAGLPQASLRPAPKREKVRLAIVSNHFRRHSVWDVIVRGILLNLDLDRFEVALYSTGNIEDQETRLAESLADIWRSSRTIGSVSGWLEAIATDQPDVIFYPEIGMDHTTLCLAARRLAPLQAASWGHPITTGLPAIDLYLSGDLLEAPDADEHYRERLVRLPGTGCCTTPIELKPEPLPELAAELATRPGPRFVIAQTPFKFEPAHDGLFAGIAAAVGECTFILVGDAHLPWAMEQLIERLSRAFVARNLDPKKYLRVVPWMPREKFYSLLDLSDIFLDCLAFSGYTTAWQAVQRGLPVVTLEGKFMRQRLASGLLRKIGMTDTIAASVDEYVEIAKRLAVECRDADRRDARRRALRSAAPLADEDASVVRAFERSLIEALAERGRRLESGAAPAVPDRPEPAHNSAAEPAWKMLNADMHLHTLDPNYAPVGLLEMVSPAPKRVLDLGCFCGGSGRWLKQRFPGCEVVGIEMLDKAAAMAAQTYEHVIVGAFEQVDFGNEGLQPGSFDAIIAADVLEHLYNPWQALQRLRPLLAPGGAIYVSLPNVRNLNVLSALASGQWRYEGAGILDVTHIRFFTLAQASEMLIQTGWTIGDARMNPDPRLAHLLAGKNFDEMKTISMGKLKLEGLKSMDVVELMAIQFFIRAIPAPGGR